jgi:serine/threonine-protein kinase
VAGTSLRSALQQVQAAGLRARIAYVPGADPLGTVLAQHPAPGTTLPETGEVTLNVSSGPGDRPRTTVPDTTGQTVNEALESLRGANLRLIMLRREVSDQEQGGTIVAQTPEAGTDVPENAQVLVYMGAYSG